MNCVFVLNLFFFCSIDKSKNLKKLKFNLIIFIFIIKYIFFLKSCIILFYCILFIKVFITLFFIFLLLIELVLTKTEFFLIEILNANILIF